MVSSDRIFDNMRKPRYCLIHQANVLLGHMFCSSIPFHAINAPFDIGNVRHWIRQTSAVGWKIV